MIKNWIAQFIEKRQLATAKELMTLHKRQFVAAKLDSEKRVIRGFEVLESWMSQVNTHLSLTMVVGRDGNVVEILVENDDVVESKLKNILDRELERH